MLRHQILAHLFSYLPLRRVYVTLITREDHHKFFLVIIIKHFIDPKVHAREALLVCEVVADYGRSRIAIVQGDHGAEAFGAPRVPDVQLHLGAIRQGHCLLEVRAADGHIVTLREDVLTVALRDAGLPHSAVTQEDHLGLHDLPWLLLRRDRVGVLHPCGCLSCLHLQCVGSLFLFGGGPTTPGATPATSLVLLRFHYNTNN